MRLKTDIYIYEWTNSYENNCNSFFIGGNVNALIDPGLTGYVPDLLSRMLDDGIQKKTSVMSSTPIRTPTIFRVRKFLIRKKSRSACMSKKLNFYTEKAENCIAFSESTPPG